MNIMSMLASLPLAEQEELKEFLRQPNVMIVEDVDEIVPAIKQMTEKQNDNA